MNVKVLALALVLAVTPVAAQEAPPLQSTGDGGFTMPERGKQLRFPADHGAHPDFRIDWWYLTANLKGPDGTDYGAQWTLFRSALAPEVKPGWSDPQLWMGHAAVTAPEFHLSTERLSRGGIGTAGVEAEPFRAMIDDWSMTSDAAPGADQLSRLSVTARGPEFAYKLALDAKGPLVPHGDKGYSVKSQEGQASYYYSQPFYTVTGSLTLKGRDIPVTGTAWFDHEWSSQFLAKSQSGWDWFAFHLAGGEKIMAAHVRGEGGGFVFATWINPDGTAESLDGSALKVSPLETGVVAGRSIPLRWRLEIPAKRVDVTTEPVNPDSWMTTSISYWEGPVRISGSHAGEGYVEMTGY